MDQEDASDVWDFPIIIENTGLGANHGKIVQDRFEVHFPDSIIHGSSALKAKGIHYADIAYIGAPFDFQDFEHGQTFLVDLLHHIRDPRRGLEPAPGYSQLPPMIISGK